MYTPAGSVFAWGTFALSWSFGPGGGGGGEGGLDYIYMYAGEKYKS